MLFKEEYAGFSTDARTKENILSCVFFDIQYSVNCIFCNVSHLPSFLAAEDTDENGNDDDDQ